MNKKWLPILLVVALAVMVFILKRWGAKANTKPTTTTETDRAGFNRSVSLLRYSQHAKCRMDCRHITQDEVEDIMRGGKINYNKSDIKNARCPRYTLEGTTADGQHARIVFAQCKENTTVVTVIDLDKEFECHCPGDDEKYENKR